MEMSSYYLYFNLSNLPFVNLFLLNTNKFINKDGVENLLKVEFDENYINDNEEFLKNDKSMGRLNFFPSKYLKEGTKKLLEQSIPLKIVILTKEINVWFW